MKKNVPAAFAWIFGRVENRILRGHVQFSPRKGGVIVKVEVSGLPTAGFFGFHIHEGTSCVGEGFPDTLGHYDPLNLLHPMHAGDLPPLLSVGGSAYMEVLTNRFTIDQIIGKTVVIHSMPDDFNSQPAGNSGAKIACGIIRADKNSMSIE